MRTENGARTGLPTEYAASPHKQTHHQRPSPGPECNCRRRAASQEQRAGIDQINNTVSLMDRMIQQNSALVQDGVAAANTLEIQSQQLRGTVRMFKV
jgi:hypothetical protein